MKPFRFWCQKVLPLVYDDSLSYYELLCKVVDYINKLIEDEAELSEGFVELKSYVDNYFNDLDYESYIDDKLDELASSGELNRLMQPYFANLSNEVSDIQQKINVLNNRVDTFASLPSGSTSGNAELLDIRNGGNGVQYSTAGDAVRGQFLTNYVPIYRDGNSCAKNIMSSIDWEIGAIDENGNNQSATTRIRTKGYIPVNGERFYTNNENYGVIAKCYDAGGSYLGEWDFSNGGRFSPAVNGIVNPFCVGNIYRLYPGTRIRLVCYPRGTNPNPTVATAETFELNPIGYNLDDMIDFSVMTYNAGKWSFGGSGGLAPDIAKNKLANYKKFLMKHRPDIIGMQEYTTYLSTDESISASSLFSPIYKQVSHIEKEIAIYSNNIQYQSDFSYLHTTGDYSAWCCYSDMNIHGKLVRVVSGVLNIESTIAEKRRAIDKLNNVICLNRANVILMFDFNPKTEEEALLIRDYLNGYGYTTSNWDYSGNHLTMRPEGDLFRGVSSVVVKGDIVIRSMEVFEDEYVNLSSDHYPVIVHLAI